MKVTAQMHAYLSPHSMATPKDLLTEDGVRSMNFFRDQDAYWAEQGYTYIGPAEVTVDVPALVDVVANKVESLRKQAASVRAEATAKCTAIEGQIQNLLAIEFKPASDDRAGAA